MQSSRLFNLLCRQRSKGGTPRPPRSLILGAQMERRAGRLRHKALAAQLRSIQRLVPCKRRSASNRRRPGAVKLPHVRRRGHGTRVPAHIGLASHRAQQPCAWTLKQGGSRRCRGHTRRSRNSRAQQGSHQRQQVVLRLGCSPCGNAASGGSLALCSSSQERTHFLASYQPLPASRSCL
jgi:hypothetical protein